MILNKRRKPKIILTLESKNKLVAFFSLLLEIDKRTKKKSKEAKTKKVRDIGPFKITGPIIYIKIFNALGKYSLKARLFNP